MAEAPPKVQRKHLKPVDPDKQTKDSVQNINNYEKHKTGNFGSLQWPSNSYCGEKNLVIEMEFEEGGQVTLPAPKDVRSTYGADYSMTDLWLYRAAERAWGRKGDTIINDMEDLTELAILKLIPGEQIAAGAMMSKGNAINPHTAAVFNNVKSRTFSLGFECVARNQADMTRCSEVFKAFRTCSLPKPSNGGVEGGIFWKYPKRVRFKYKPDPLEILTKSDWCYIVDLDMNFTGTAGSFTSGPGGSPMMAIMSVTLQEQYPLDIQKIDDLDLR